VTTQQGTGSEGPRVRASDAEREQVAHVLRTAMGEGRLTLDEGEQRLAAVYAATYRQDLVPLTADLPDQGRYALAELPEAKLAARRDRRRRAALVAVAVLVAAVLVGLVVVSRGRVVWPAFLVFFFFVRPYTRGRRQRRR
jgi:Flp pilus assembly protein TadB